MDGLVETEARRSVGVDESPLRCALSDLGRLHIGYVRGGEGEEVWDALVREHHYLGYGQMVGRRLKYLALSGDRVVACIGWGAAALKVEVRDRFIGWSVEQRRRGIGRIAKNNRFLVLPWVRVKNIASHLLARNIDQVVRDWKERYGDELLLVETYVDGELYAGSCYRGAGWVHVGQTRGYTKRGQGYVYHGHPKEVYVYVVDKRFRQIIGCERRPVPRRSVKIDRREGQLQMVLRHAGWSPEVVPQMQMSEEEVEAPAEELVSFHEEFRGYYKRREQRQLGLTYLRGLLTDLERKNVEAMALVLLGPRGVRVLQDFIGGYRWDDEGMKRAYQGQLSELIVQEDGMISVDSSEFAKKGKESVGVARQYCGALGKVENCQSGVFVGYAGEKGYGIVDWRLYVPEKWFGQEYEERRQKCRVPEDLEFRTKTQIAQELIEQIESSGRFRARWLGCDAGFGGDWKFLDRMADHYWYFAQVPSSTYVWVGEYHTRVSEYGGKGRPSSKPEVVGGRRVRVRELAQEPGLGWTRVRVAEGAKGPIREEVVALRVAEEREGVAGAQRWLFIRRYEDGHVKYALSNAPEEIGLQELVRASTLRWPIEQCFQEGKSQLGMDHYEHRSWLGWHRHMLFVFLAGLFLLRLRYRFQKKRLP